MDYLCYYCRCCVCSFIYIGLCILLSVGFISLHIAYWLTTVIMIYIFSKQWFLICTNNLLHTFYWHKWTGCNQITDTVVVFAHYMWHYWLIKCQIFFHYKLDVKRWGILILICQVSIWTHSLSTILLSFLASTAQSDQSDNLFCLSVSLNLVGYNATNMA